MYEIHDLHTEALAAEVAYRRAQLAEAASRTNPSRAPRALPAARARRWFRIRRAPSTRFAH